jgi:hypothetical protein
MRPPQPGHEKNSGRSGLSVRSSGSQKLGPAVLASIGDLPGTFFDPFHLVAPTAHSCGSHPGKSVPRLNRLRKDALRAQIVPSRGFVPIPKVSLARAAGVLPRADHPGSHSPRRLKERLRPRSRDPAIPQSPQISPKPLSWIAPAAATLEQVGHAAGDERWSQHAGRFIRGPRGRCRRYGMWTIKFASLLANKAGAST